MNNKITPSIFVPHGGGPWNLMGEQYMKHTGEDKLKKYFNDLGKKYEDVDAIIMITSHWEDRDINISFVENYNLLYDYSGFPQNTYNVDYKAKGNLKLSEKIEEVLNKNNIKTKRDTKRGLDHGSFIPLMEMYPNANIPVVQISISSNLDSKYHYNLGKTLAPFKKENILIIGSGMSYHNMTGFFSNNEKYKDDSVEFNKFLEKNITNTDELLNWENNILAKQVHPRSEHFMPFFTILGTSVKDKISRNFKGDNHGIEIIGYEVK